MEFAYKVRDPLANTHQGTMSATSAEEAAQTLRQDGFHILELEEASGEALGGLFAKPIKRSDIIHITTQLAVMVETGITISAALETIASQEENPTLRKVLNDLKSSVESGENFSTALERFPKQFDITYVSLVRASEATGTLAEMLDRIAVYLNKEMETRSKVRSAMAYPAVMLVIAIAVTIFLLTYILPKFTPMFNRPGFKLPKATVVMMTASDAMIGYWYLWVAGIIALIIGFLYARRTEPGRKAIDWAKIHTPIIGPLCRKVAISRSIRTLATMVKSGVSMLEALQLSADVSGNYYYRHLWIDVMNQVTGGRQICDSLAGNKLIPPMLVQMISSGEETGKLDTVLFRVSTFFDHEVDSSIKSTTSLIEPLMITAMGVVVGGIAMGLLLPIFSLSKPSH